MAWSVRNDFNFEKAHRFQADVQDVLIWYDRNTWEAKQSRVLSYFQPPTSTTADKEPQLSALRQADIEERVDVSHLPALMDSDNDDTLADGPCLSFLYPSLRFFPQSTLRQLSLTQGHHHRSASRCVPCRPDSGEWNYTAYTVFLLYTGCVSYHSTMLVLF